MKLTNPILQLMQQMAPSDDRVQSEGDVANYFSCPTFDCLDTETKGEGNGLAQTDELINSLQLMQQMAPSVVRVES